MDVRDQLILAAIRNHDKHVFEELYKAYYRQLFALAFRYVRQAPAAEEIVHDVFLVVWNKSETLNVRVAIKSYLYRAVINTSLNYLKKHKLELGKQEAYIRLNAEGQTEDKEAEEALLQRLEKAIDILPPKCREVMYLSRFGKLKQQEIAEQMQISLKTVKNHLTYGFQRIREHLGNNPQHLSVLILILLRYFG